MMTNEKKKKFHFYRKYVKNREYDREVPQNLRAERVTMALEQGASEHANLGERPTPPETNFSRKSLQI